MTCPFKPFGRRSPSAYRELLVDPYRLVYRVESARVVVVEIFDGRRNLEDLLLDRLLRDG